MQNRDLIHLCRLETPLYNPLYVFTFTLPQLGTGDIEVLHMGRVRHDWQGGKHDLSVRQGNRVEIIRVKNNPEGRWLARTQTGTCE